MEPKRCYGCMKLKTQTPLCEHCGYNEYIDNLSHQLPLGTVLQGRYEIGKVLGQGGFGITYIGWDHARETTVAVKEFYPGGIVNREAAVSPVLNVNSADSAEAFERNRKRFLQEAHVLKKLNDIPQIVHVENLFEENNTAYIVMEYIRGVDLRRYIRMVGGKLSVNRTFDILCPIMEALQKAHEAGLVHRDVSPDNIMLMPDGKAKLLDFGAAREVMAPELGHVQSTEAILKHGFAPIEQYQRSGTLGPWTDVYALSATVFYCLTGQIPPDAPKRIMDGVEIPWSTIPGLSSWQAEVLKKAMEPMPRNRTRSIEEVRTALFAGPISGEQPWIEPEPVPDPKPEPEPADDSGSVIQEIPQSGSHGKKNGGGLKHDTAEVSGKKRPWVKIAAIAAAAAVVILGAAALLKGGSDAPKTSSGGVSQSLDKSKAAFPTASINKNVPSQVDMGAIFTGNPDRTITYADGSRAESYLTNELETARALFDEDGELVYRFLADYNENGDMLYQLTFDAGNACLRADTYTYDDSGNLITKAIILESGEVYKTWAYGINADGEQESVVVWDHNNEITMTGVYEFGNSKTATSYTATYSDGSYYKRTYDSDGNVASYISYDEEGKFEYWSEYQYDADGRRSQYISRKEDGKVQRTVEYTYNSEDQVTGETAYDDVNEVESRTEHTYQYGERVSSAYTYSWGYEYTYYNMCDISGNTVRSYDTGTYDNSHTYYTIWGGQESQVSYDVETGELSGQSEYHYDEDYNFLGYSYVSYSSYDGSRYESEYDSDYNRIISRSYDKDGNLKSWTEPEYDENNNEVKSTTYNADGSIDSIDEWYYDENGERTGGTYTYFYEDGSTTVYVMDENMDFQSRTQYDANGNVTDVSTYEYEYDERGKKTKEFVFDENGELDYWTEYFYDENGNYLDSEWHNA